MFDCSWISNYSEENERLFIGYTGDYMYDHNPLNMQRLRICSIRIIETSVNHEAFFNVLHIFDLLLSGGDMSGTEVTETSLKIITELLKIKLVGGGADVDKYMMDCFNLYSLKKRNVIIDLRNVYKYKVPHLFHDLHPWKENEINKCYIEYIDNFHGLRSLNLLNVKLLQAIFPNLDHIKMTEVNDYEFCLSSFLSIIQDSTRNIEYQIQACRGGLDDDQDTWLFEIPRSIVSEYKQKQYNIEYEETGTYTCYDNLFINRQCV